MKAIKIYTQDSKYFMEDLDTNQTVELTNPKFDKGSGKNWFILPENSIGQKAICKEMIDLKGEVTRAERAKKTINSPKTPKFNPEDYLDEKQIEKRRKLLEEVAKIDAIAEAEYKKVQALNEVTETIKNFTPEMIAALKATLN